MSDLILQDLGDFPADQLGRIIQEVAVMYARLELWKDIREATPNDHERIRQYWLNVDPPLDISTLAKKPPWCAVFVQYVTDQACFQFGEKNPLDAVKLEAYVQDYVRWARESGKLLAEGAEAMAGDLVVFSFGKKRYDHIGIVVAGRGPKVVTIEGNTGDVNQREGDGVYQKTRDLTTNQARLIRWRA